MCSHPSANFYPRLSGVAWITGHVATSRFSPSIRVFSCCGLVLFAVCCLTPRLGMCQSSEEQIATHFHSGQEALRQGDNARAVAEFKKVLALDPVLVEAEVNLGLAYHSLAEYDLAARHLTKALQRRPTLLAANVIAGADYLKIGNPEKAIPLLDRALKLDGSNREAREALASAYISEQHFGAAAEQFRRVADLNPDKSEAWFKLGHEYLELSARLAYRGAHLYHESSWGHRFLGDLLFERGRWEEAAREYAKAVNGAPNQPGLHTALGQAYLHAGKILDADAELHRELALDAKNELAWLGLSEIALEQGQAETALRNIVKVWEISPEFLALQRQFPSIDLPPDSAKALADQLQASAASSAASHFLLSALYASSGLSTLSEQETKIFDGDVLQWQEKARTTHMLAAPAKACDEHQYSDCVDVLRRLKLATDSSRLALGKALFAIQHYREAADVLAEVSNSAKQNEESSYWLALGYRALGADCYAKLEEGFPDSWRTHQLRGEGYALKQDLDNAIKEFQSALQLQPASSELHEALGEAYLNHHSDEEAQKELEKSLELNPSATRSLYLLGKLYVQNRENDKALPYLQKAIRLQPDLAEASSLLGTAYVRLGQFTNAIPQLERAAPSDHYGNVHYELYLAYRKVGQSALAQKALARSQYLRRASLERDQALVMGTQQPDDNQ